VIAVIVINYRQVAMTLECLAALYAHAGTPFHLFLIDNAADSASLHALHRFTALRDNVTLISNEANVGFAQACNQALDQVWADPRFTAVALLNNDTLIEPDWLARMARCLAPDQGLAMVAGRMMDYHRPDQIDSLGIVFYKTGIASNRKELAEPLLGPCGGAALYDLGLLDHLRRTTGYVFDPDFFCYAEDTDLALRARALGYGCAFAHEAVLRHRGSASSGGGYNEFVAYQGLRNSLFALVKNLPASFLARHLGWILAMQLSIAIKYLIKAQPRLIWRVYRDFWRGLPRILRQRHILQAGSCVAPVDWDLLVSHSFYDPSYISHGLRTLLKRDIHPARVPVSDRLPPGKGDES
jgi:hypothetical protein